MACVSDIQEFLQQLLPLELAEDWDNVGLLIGDPAVEVRRLTTCLTLTPDVAAEAIAAETQLVVSHHPILFRPVQRLTTETVEGEMLLHLIRHQVAVFSPHTSYDSAAQGINRQLADGLGLCDVAPLVPAARTADTADSLGAVDSGESGHAIAAIGAGRFGDFSEPIPLADLIARVRTLLRVEHVRYVGTLEQPVRRIAVACGAGGSFLKDALRAGCDAFVTGEASFHSCLEARTAGVAVILPGHFATERPAMEFLAKVLADQFPDVEVVASAAETDPIQWA